MSAAAWVQLFIGLAIFALGYALGAVVAAFDIARKEELREQRFRERLRQTYDRRAD